MHQALRGHEGPQSASSRSAIDREMETLDYSDLYQIRASADTLLVDAGLGLPTIASTSDRRLRQRSRRQVTIPSRRRCHRLGAHLRRSDMSRTECVDAECTCAELSRRRV